MGRGNVLLLVENASVPQDPRVWWECQVLTAAGFRVTVVCPVGKGAEGAEYELREGVAIHRFPVAEKPGVTGHVVEYAQAARRTARLVRRLAGGQRFDVVHACNPPDFLLLTALPLKRSGTRFVFDHHDLSPEMFLDLYGPWAKPFLAVVRVLERVSFALADVVISTNESYRRVALQRGRKRPEDVFVVRNAPDLAVFRPSPADRQGGDGPPHLLSYAGVMGRQDGVEEGLRALASLRRRRSDWRAVFVGDGPALPDARRLAAELGLADAVEFSGWVTQDRVRKVLAASDVCLSPEPATAYSNASTLIKVGEYMAMGKPIVCYDLGESRFTAGPAASYARPGDVDHFAECISRLLDDPGRRAEMGAAGRARIAGPLSPVHAEQALLAAYERALDRVAVV